MEESRKVIFVGGTAYSGSTFLDMTLANSPQGFSCGEVNAFFFPYRAHHLDPPCGCKNDNCELWKILRSVGVSRFYEKIFELFPKVRFIVDSSKDPLWIYDRSNDLRKSGLGVENVLIWKTPQEYYQSCAKRGEEGGWKRRWVNYHRFYFRMVQNWYGVRYADIGVSDEILSALCQRLAIPYFEGKRNYWEKEHHTLFGNTSAKVHLYGKETERYKQYREERDARLITQIDINSPVDDRQEHPWNKAYPNETESYLEKIDHVLSARSVGRINSGDGQGDKAASWDRSIDDRISSLKLPHLYEKYRRLRRYIEVKSPKWWPSDDQRRF